MGAFVTILPDTVLLNIFDLSPPAGDLNQQGGNNSPMFR